MNDPIDSDSPPSDDHDETVLTPQFDADQIDVGGSSPVIAADEHHQRLAAVSKHRRVQRFPAGLPTGYTIDEFRIISSLGQGAFASVYLAQQIPLRRLVALKISRSLADGGIDAGESRTLARLDHPGIVRVFDQRRIAKLDVHLLYMQYLPGGTLASVVDRVRHLRRQGVTDSSRPVELTGQVLLDSVNENLLAAAQQVPEHSQQRDWLATASWPIVVAWIGMQLGRALQAAHEQGVYHRDVKPANVLLSAEGLPRLADFNVSFTTNASISLPNGQHADDQQAGDHDDAEDTANRIGGSLAYMAPEHLAALAEAMFPTSSSQDVRSQQDPSFAIAAPADVYSAGVLLWELWQGQRPFDDEPPPIRDRQWFVKHAAHRDHDPVAVTRAARSDGSQRVLEQVLRQAITYDASKRMQSAGELSARLRLALYPEAARLFDPPERSWASRCTRVSPWLIAAAFILLPNIAAGAFNYLYNYVEIIGRHPELKPRFFALATTINSVFFPLGGLLMIWAARPAAVAIGLARRDAVVDPTAVSLTAGLGRRAAWIGGLLWLVAAIIFSMALVTGSPSLPPVAAMHFFGSLLICGGVAAVYPFFGLIVMTTRVYYPCMIRKTMQDDFFDQRHADAKTWCGRFLLAAAGIPLLGLALLLSQETMAKYVVASAVAATAIGLAAAFAASQIVQSSWEVMAEVLSSRKQQEF